jgi:hypothetical protein
MRVLGKELQVYNRKSEIVTEKGISFIRYNEQNEEGIVWLPIEDFSTGTVILKLRGKAEVQRSFIGVAFHGVDEKTYDAIYCRPFNFKTQDSVPKIHAIQYISHPMYTWKKLREEQNGKYEKGIRNAPLPNQWFTLKLKITRNKVVSYVNGKKVLSIKKISTIFSGKIGLFMGSNSGGNCEYIIINQE